MIGQRRSGRAFVRAPVRAALIPVYTRINKANPMRTRRPVEEKGSPKKATIPVIIPTKIKATPPFIHSMTKMRLFSIERFSKTVKNFFYGYDMRNSPQE